MRMQRQIRKCLPRSPLGTCGVLLQSTHPGQKKVEAQIEATFCLSSSSSNCSPPLHFRALRTQPRRRKTEWDWEAFFSSSRFLLKTTSLTSMRSLLPLLLFCRWISLCEETYSLSPPLSFPAFPASQDLCKPVLPSGSSISSIRKPHLVLTLSFEGCSLFPLTESLTIAAAVSGECL